MHPLAEHVDTLLALMTALAAGLMTAIIYIWKGNVGKSQEIAHNQAECMASLSKRFVPVEIYREDIQEIFKRQSELRDRLPRDFIMRSESEIFMGSLKELKGEITAMREAFESRMDRLVQQLILAGSNH